MPGYFHELRQEQADIRNAIEQNKTEAEIYSELRDDGVKTNPIRLSHFCEEIRQEKKLSPVEANGGQQRFNPSQYFLNLHKESIKEWLFSGCNPREIAALLLVVGKMRPPDAHVEQFCSELLLEVYPEGTTNQELLTIPKPNRTWSDDDEVMYYGDDKVRDVWQLKDFCQGTIIFGAPGSGKTSGSGRTIASNFLKKGFGGIVFTAKENEAQNWMKLAAMCGRADDLVVLELGGAIRLNFLQYEQDVGVSLGSISSNLVNFFQNILTVTSPTDVETPGREFWKATGQQLITNVIETFTLAKEPISLDAMCSFVDSAPSDAKSAKDGAWEELPVFGDILAEAAKNAASGSLADQRLFQKVSSYWLSAFPNLAEETRSCITISFSALADILRQRHIYDLVSTNTTFTPEKILAGKILIINLPTNTYHEAGAMVQAGWKYMLQRAILRRKDRGKERRPVFFWEDEAQNFLIDHDTDFQAVCREYRAVRVLITQNLNNFYSRFGGGASGHAKIDGLIANINTRIFHANGDQTTNKWASELLGTHEKMREEKTYTPEKYQGNNPLLHVLSFLKRKETVTRAERISREAIVQPHEFTTLQTGNESNGYITDAFVCQTGRTLKANDLHFGVFSFRQIHLPDSLVPDHVIENAIERKTP